MCAGGHCRSPLFIPTPTIHPRRSLPSDIVRTSWWHAMSSTMHVMTLWHMQARTRRSTTGKRAGSSGKRPHAMRSCAFLKPATVLPHCPHLQCTLSHAPTWPTLILAIAWDPQEASSRNSFSECLVRAHGAWGSAGCMGECSLHGRVQDAWESAGCQVRVQGARESARCMGECRVHRRVQGALESAGCQVQVQGAWESTACVGTCRVHRRVPGCGTLTEPNPD